MATATKPASALYRAAARCAEIAASRQLSVQPVVCRAPGREGEAGWAVSSGSRPGLVYHLVWVELVGGLGRLMCTCEARRSGRATTCSHAQAVRLSLLALLDRAGAASLPACVRRVAAAARSGAGASSPIASSSPLSVAAPVAAPASPAHVMSSVRAVPCPRCGGPASVADITTYGVCGRCATEETGDHCPICGSSYALSETGEECPLGHGRPRRPGGTGPQPIPTPVEAEAEAEPTPAPDPDDDPPAAHLTRCPTCGDEELTEIIQTLGECVTCTTRAPDPAPTPGPLAAPATPVSQDELEEEYRRSRCSCGREKSPDRERCDECEQAYRENVPAPAQPSPEPKQEPQNVADLPAEDRAEYERWADEQDRATQEREEADREELAALQTETAEHARRRHRAEAQERTITRAAAKRHPRTSSPATPEPAPVARRMPASRARRAAGSVTRGTTTKVYGREESPPASSDPRPFSIFKQ